MIDLERETEWDNIVKGFKQHDIYYLGSYAKSFGIHGDGVPQLIYYDDNETKAISVVFKRDISQIEIFKNKIPPKTWYDFSTPYGYGGFLIEGKEQIKLNNMYNEYCLENNIVSEFVRFHPVLQNAIKLRDMYEVIDLGSTIHMDLSDKSLLWDNLSVKNKNVIRKAKSLGVKIYWGRSPELFDEFRYLYNRTMESINADDYYYFGKEFYYSILNDLNNNSLIFYATVEGKIVSMAIILFCNSQMHYHLSCSDVAYRHYAPTNLLLFKVALWGNANGFKTLHLGGGLGSVEDNLFKFKKSFNRRGTNIFSVGRKCYNEVMYRHLVEIRNENKIFDIDSGYFPLYRFGK